VVVNHENGSAIDNNHVCGSTPSLLATLYARLHASLYTTLYSSMLGSKSVFFDAVDRDSKPVGRLTS
jgi:hypothetical protein